jgi:hypothetical protein
VHELIPVGGRDVPATLTGSRAGIDRQVLSLEVTEAIGGVIALALLAALARATGSACRFRRSGGRPDGTSALGVATRSTSRRSGRVDALLLPTE